VSGGAILGSPGATIGGVVLGAPVPPPRGPNPLVRDPANWTPSYVPLVPGAVAGQVLPSEIAQLDAQLSGSINGDDGSTHAPVTSIEIGGQGVTVTGPTTIQQGATLQCLNTTPAATINLEAGDYPQFVNNNPFATHSYLQLCNDGVAWPRYTWHTRREDSGQQALSSTFDLSDGFGQRQSPWYVRLRPHDGATLTSVTVTFRIGYPHAQLPTAMPQVGIAKYDAAGNFLGSLTSAAAGANAAGLVPVAKPSSAAAWYKNGAVQSITITCDQNNVIDVSQYFYKLVLVEEAGLTGYPWQLVYKQAVRVTAPPPWYTIGFRMHEGILAPGGGPLILDGVTIKNGDRVLFNSALPQGTPFGDTPQVLSTFGYLPPPPAAYDGIWIADSAGQWGRSPDLPGTAPAAPNTSSPLQAGIDALNAILARLGGGGQQTASAPVPHFFQGMVVPVLSGTKYGGSFWQVPPSITSWSDAAPNAIQQFPSGGNVPGWYFGSTVGIATDGQLVGNFPTLTKRNGYARVYPSKPNGYWYTLTTEATLPNAGTFQPILFEPSWPTTIGDTVTVFYQDSLSSGLVSTGAVFTCSGKTGTPISFLPRPDTSNPVEGSGLIAHGIIWHAAKLTHQVSDLRFQ
jgi:hypothetical protein